MKTKTPATTATCTGKDEDCEEQDTDYNNAASFPVPILSQDLEEEIDSLYCSVPEVANHFIITDRIGEGAFSTVYKAKLKHYPEVEETFALKHIIPTSHPSRIENELKCLLKIGGTDNVMGVKLCLRNRDHVVVIMPLFSHDKFQDILPLISVMEMREYMRNLLISLRRVHEFNVIHRDIKPSNFLYNRQKKEYALVDFGLASFSANFSGHEETGLTKNQEHSAKRSSLEGASSRTLSGRSLRSPLSPSKRAVNKSNIAACNSKGKLSQKPEKMCKAGPSVQRNSASRKTASPLTSTGHCDCFGKPVVCHLCVARSNQLAPRAGTAGFRPPEVLLKSSDQCIAVDVWSAGVIFLSMLSGRYPFFRAQDDMGYLAQIISLLGTDSCLQAADSIGKLLTVSENIPSVDLRHACLRLRSSQINSRNQSADVKESWENINDLPFDLLAKMLDPNPKLRISAQDALEHPFFSEVS